MHNAGVWKRIETFNKGRDPERLLLKYQAMQNDTFSFLRGTSHLFYQDWPKDSPLNQAPLAWISGDLHLENFGAYKGDNRLTYFDINDFDEAALAPCTLDLSRFLCSILVGAQTLGVEQAQALQLCETLISSYTKEILACKPRWVERATATGMIRFLLKTIKRRSRSQLLSERTQIVHGERQLKVDGVKAIAATEAEKQHVITLVDRFAAKQAKPDFFRVLDVARRIAGIGSLGLERYVILVYGKGLDNHYLLDLKYQPGSVLTHYLSFKQPNWNSEAERVVTLQHRGQAIAPAFLSVITDGDRSYVLKELMPQQDRLHLRHWNGKFKRLQKVISSMGELVAWQHMRTGGWRGAAIADQWLEFGQNTDWQQPLLDYALTYSRKVRLDWLSFKEEKGSKLPGASD
jgi:uncharacterized protein (DUF2252 family)